MFSTTPTGALGDILRYIFALLVIPSYLGSSFSIEKGFLVG
jgi:hypothetical protein